MADLSIEQQLYNDARDRAKKKGLLFTLKLKDIKIPKRCPITGIRFTKDTKFSASLDRINNKRGYTADNIWVISTLANKQKRTKTMKQFLKDIVLEYNSTGTVCGT